MCLGSTHSQWQKHCHVQKHGGYHASEAYRRLIRVGSRIVRGRRRRGARDFAGEAGRKSTNGAYVDHRPSHYSALSKLNPRTTREARELAHASVDATLSRESTHDLWREWHNDQAYARRDENALWRGFVARSPTMCARLALILHLLTYPLGPCMRPLSAETLQHAIVLSDYSLTHGRYALDRFGGSFQSEESLTPERAALLADLQQHGESRPSDVAARMSKAGTTVQTVMTKMASAGVIQRTRYGYYAATDVDSVDNRVNSGLQKPKTLDGTVYTPSESVDSGVDTSRAIATCDICGQRLLSDESARNGCCRKCAIERKVAA